MIPVTQIPRGLHLRATAAYETWLEVELAGRIPGGGGLRAEEAGRDLRARAAFDIARIEARAGNAARRNAFTTAVAEKRPFGAAG